MLWSHKDPDAGIRITLLSTRKMSMSSISVGTEVEMLDPCPTDSRHIVEEFIADMNGDMGKPYDCTIV
ncbi:hypothetical protein HZ326_20135 [Fusarium oxysporum f. sp. albedinis]|nr:hypothetical protein HZ326_20135 [Fusarium oxysporum f. sp. albedinis]